MKMKRRDFGRRLLEAAAAVGVSHVGPSLLASLSGCMSDVGEEDVELVPARLVPSGRTANVVIVGAGYGSAVTARRLTEAGIPVTLFEMGRLWDKPDKDGKIFSPLLEPDGRSMWFRDQTEAVVKTFGPIPTALPIPRQAGVLDVLGPESMRVFCGRGVGGGSLVNLAVYVTPVREVFERVFPGVDADAMYQTYFPRALQALRAAEVGQDLIDADCNQYSRVGIEAAERVGIKCMRVTSGYDYDYMRKEVQGTVPRSALGGEAAYGNNSGKRSLDKTYLAEAMGTGLLTIHALHQVMRIQRDRSVST
jgi:cholesterol oxidase